MIVFTLLVVIVNLCLIAIPAIKDAFRTARMKWHKKRYERLALKKALKIKEIKEEMVGKVKSEERRKRTGDSGMPLKMEPKVKLETIQEVDEYVN